jgi:hypothetical protein
MKKFTLKVRTNGLVTKYRFNNQNSIPKLLAYHMRLVGHVQKAWIKDNLTNMEDYLRMPSDKSKHFCTGHYVTD